MMKSIKIIRGTAFRDQRGLLWTSWKKKSKQKLEFNHDKFSISKKKVLRGLHYDNKTWKLISCVYGKVFFDNLPPPKKIYWQKFNTLTIYTMKEDNMVSRLSSALSDIKRVCNKSTSKY